jgi:hypothetical protein
MSGLLAATQPARTIVVKQGGTPWWVPLLATLLIGIAAAIASYLATWWFKKRDIDGDNARQAALFVDEAERALPRPTASARQTLSDPLETVSRLLRKARLRAQPLDDFDLDQRMDVALYFFSDAQEWGAQPVGARPWMQRAIDNVRVGLAPYLAPPPIIPRRPQQVFVEKLFPRFDEYIAIKRFAEDDPEGVTQGLDDWFAEDSEEEAAEAVEAQRQFDEEHKRWMEQHVDE